MNKRIILAISIAMVMVMAGTAAVYAIGARPVENGADKGTGIIANNTVPAEEALQPEPVKEINLAPFNFPMGTKAEAILRDVLSKKEMSEIDIKVYNSMPDEIKQLDYYQARLKEAEHMQNFERLDKRWEDYTREEKDYLYEQSEKSLVYKNYAESIATGMELAKIKCEKFKSNAESTIEANKHFLAIHYDRYSSVQNAMYEFMLLVLEDMEEEMADANGDYQALIDRIEYMQNYRDIKRDSEFMSVSEEDFARYTQQYLNGVPLEEILG